MVHRNGLPADAMQLRSAELAPLNRSQAHLQAGSSRAATTTHAYMYYSPVERV